MIWAFKVIGKILLYSFYIPFVMVCLPFYLPYFLIKERKNKKNGLMTIKRGQIPKYSSSMSWQDYEVYCAKQLAHEGYHTFPRTCGGDPNAENRMVCSHITFELLCRLPVSTVACF